MHVCVDAHVQKHRVILCFLSTGGSKTTLWGASGGTLEPISKVTPTKGQQKSHFGQKGGPFWGPIFARVALNGVSKIRSMFKCDFGASWWHVGAAEVAGTP